MTRSVESAVASVPFSDLANRGGLGARASEDLQRGQPGDDVEEVAAKPLQRAQLAVHALARGGPHERHEQRDQRNREGDDRRGDPVFEEHHGEHDDGHDHGEEQLRQVQREPPVERVDPPRGEDRKRPGALLARAVNAELRHAPQQRAAQL